MVSSGIPKDFAAFDALIASSFPRSYVKYDKSVVDSWKIGKKLKPLSNILCGSSGLSCLKSPPVKYLPTVLYPTNKLICSLFCNY